VKTTVPFPATRTPLAALTVLMLSPVSAVPQQAIRQLTSHTASARGGRAGQARVQAAIYTG
jgi:hypothetical protein